jgi:hypothetical protein
MTFFWGKMLLLTLTMQDFLKKFGLKNSVKYCLDPVLDGSGNGTESELLQSQNRNPNKSLRSTKLS